jgi:hypothetical protein
MTRLIIEIDRVSFRFVSVLGGKVALPRTVEIGNDAPPDDVSQPLLRGEIMHHNFGLSPFPLTARRPSSTNKRPVPVIAPTSIETDTPAPEGAMTSDRMATDESTGGEK